MTTDPFLSILVPTYNRAAPLRRCISSVLALEETDFELLVSDNASPDNTQAVLKGFQDSRLTFWRNETNIGAEGNFQCLCQKARGEWVFLLADDDYLDCRGMEKTIAIAKENADLGAIVSTLKNDWRGGTMPDVRYLDHSTRLDAGAESLEKLFFSGMIFSRLMYRRAFSDPITASRFSYTQYPQVHILGKVLRDHPSFYLDEHVVHHTVGNETYWTFQADFMTRGLLDIIDDLLSTTEYRRTRKLLIRRLADIVGWSALPTAWRERKFINFHQHLLRSPEVLFNTAYLRRLLMFLARQLLIT